VSADPRDHEFVHKLGAAVVVDETAPAGRTGVREVTDGGAERVLACAASSLSGAEVVSLGDSAQAHRTGERGDIPGEVVLVIDDDLAATLEI
jgi:hypothetical protein